MSFSRPIQRYHSLADPIWPDGTLKYYSSLYTNCDKVNENSFLKKVQDVPASPPSRPMVSRISSRTVLLTWATPLQNNHAPISNYRIFIRWGVLYIQQDFPAHLGHAPSEQPRPHIHLQDIHQVRGEHSTVNSILNIQIFCPTLEPHPYKKILPVWYRANWEHSAVVHHSFQV